MNDILTIDLGRTRYGDAWEVQKRVFSARLANRIPDVVIFTEHEHVYTLGKGADENHLLADDSELEEKRIDLFRIDRGGDVTYHGPGQIVGYPILDLTRYYRDVHRYLRDIEEVLIRTLNDFGVRGERSEGYTGVWVKNEKIAAIGVKVSRWITMHGFAFNVETDLSYFDRIIPCGIFHKGICSLATVTRARYSMEEVRRSIIGNFQQVFSVTARDVPFEELAEMLHDEKSYATEENS